MISLKSKIKNMRTEYGKINNRPTIKYLFKVIIKNLET